MQLPQEKCQGTWKCNCYCIQFAMMSLPVLKALHSFAHVDSAPCIARQFLNGCLKCGHTATLPTGKQGVYKANYGYLLYNWTVSDCCWFLGFLRQERKDDPDTLKGTFSPATTAVECVYGKLYRNSTEKRHEKAISHMISVEACRYDRIQSIFSITLNIPVLPKMTKSYHPGLLWDFDTTVSCLEQVTPPGPMRILPTDFGTMNFSTIFEFLELANLGKARKVLSWGWHG